MIVCRRCGQRNDPATEFCAACGAYLEWDGHPVAPPSPPGPAPEVWAPPAGPPSGAPGVPAPGGAVPGGAPGGPGSGGAVPGGAAPAPGPGGKVRCLECGAGNQGGSRFCRRCGATLDLVVLAGPSTIPPPVPTEQHPPSPPVPSGRCPATPTTPPVLPVPSVRPPSPSVPTEQHPPSPPVPTGRPPVPPVPAGQAPVPTPPPGVARGEGLQPATVPTGPAPVRPELEVAPVPPGGSACPRCGAGNERGRRFCRRCGEAFDVPAPPGAPAPTPKTSWWRRRRGEAAAPSARAAYRRALDIRFRVLRVLAAVATLGMGAGLLGVSGIDPVEGARDLWRRVFPRDEAVADVTATVDPAAGEQREFGPGAAVDGAPDTAWGATWGRTPDDDPLPACAPDAGTGGADAALVLGLPEPTELSKLEVQVGLPQGDPDRENQWRPTLLELRYDDGSCETLELAPDPGPQRHSIDAPRTGSVRITILAAAPPPSGTGTLTTLATVRLLHPS